MKFLIPLLLIVAPLAAQEIIDIGTQRELFVESSLVDRLEGEATLRMHHPVARVIAISHDVPWEGTSSGYHTVFQDGDIYRMYHRGLHIDVSEGKISTGRHEPFYCYAESKDGIEWTRPELGIIEFEDSKKNNIILRGPGTHNFAPFKDANPDCEPEARYKALGGGQSGLIAFQSADGVHWSPMNDGKPVITAGAFDSQNLGFWDPTIGKYRAYWRIFTEGITTAEVWKPAGVRAIRTATSSDFITWEEDADLKYEDSPEEQLYTNQVSPYVRAQQVLIGLPTRYIDRGWSPAMEALPDADDRKLRASANERYGTALTEVVLMASRDGVNFKRWNEAFMRPGIERPGTWQYGQHYAACHAVVTKSTLPGAGDELSIYASESGWHGVGNAIRRYTLRLDGFVSVNASAKGGEVITKPFKFGGNQLELNFSTSAVGSVFVEIQSPDGTPLDGFSLADCHEMFGDTTERTVLWKDQKAVSELAGKPVRLRFSLKDADLYAYRFTDN
ncbi:MAG: hypothetical protein ACI8UO_001186 [Verrucomicrobiales bacterium]|jgi:hypothetical protein